MFPCVIACIFIFQAEITGFCPKLAIFRSILITTKKQNYVMIHHLENDPSTHPPQLENSIYIFLEAFLNACNFNSCILPQIGHFPIYFDKKKNLSVNTSCFSSKSTNTPCLIFLLLSQIGYDRNRIIWPETGTEPEVQFRLTGTGFTFKNSGSG